jgi:dTDP-4-dehydrorhamnose reductase
MNILVIGRSGQLARALELCGAGQARLRCLGREEVDLTIPGQAEAAILAGRPDLVINAAAYTAVDDAETNRDAAFRNQPGRGLQDQRPGGRRDRRCH